MSVPQFSKDLVNTPSFKVTIAQVGAEFKLITAIGATAGGGNLAGFAKVGGQIEADLEEKVVIDAGLGAIEAKFQSNAVILEALQGLQVLIDAQFATAPASS